MNKYSSEFKLEVVKYCIEKRRGCRNAAKHFNIPSRATVNDWLRKYKEHGLEGLMRSPNSLYSGEFKQNVVEYMHENHLSLTQTAIKFNISNHSIVGRWERIYYEEGPQGLYKEFGGKTTKMNNKKIDKSVEDDLIAENQRLRMENEYLKKLHALVQERIKRENKKKK